MLTDQLNRKKIAIFESRLGNLNICCGLALKTIFFSFSFFLPFYAASSSSSIHPSIHLSLNKHRFTCNTCGKRFVRKYNWLRHSREHEREKKFTCDICNKKFHRAYYLTEHKRVHTGERPFSCTICGKTSATKTNHNKHIKIHHARDPLTAEG